MSVHLPIKSAAFPISVEKCIRCHRLWKMPTCRICNVLMYVVKFLSYIFLRLSQLFTFFSKCVAISQVQLHCFLEMKVVIDSVVSDANLYLLLLTIGMMSILTEATEHWSIKTFSSCSWINNLVHFISSPVVFHNVSEIKVQYPFERLKLSLKIRWVSWHLQALHNTVTFYVNKSVTMMSCIDRDIWIINWLLFYTLSNACRCN